MDVSDFDTESILKQHWLPKVLKRAPLFTGAGETGASVAPKERDEGVVWESCLPSAVKRACQAGEVCAPLFMSQVPHTPMRKLGAEGVCSYEMSPESWGRVWRRGHVGLRHDQDSSRQAVAEGRVEGFDGPDWDALAQPASLSKGQRTQSASMLLEVS